MNSTQALARLRKIIGPKAVVRDSKHPSSPEQMERARVAEEARTARRDALLAADSEYQKLQAEYETAKAAVNKLPLGTYYRYEAGHLVSGLFFHVDGQADTLAELVEKVTASK